MNEVIEFIGISLGCLGVSGFLVGLYFLPTLIALAMHNVNTVAILLLNIFTGWTFIGWVASLIWAMIK